MEEITRILLKIIRLMQILILLGSALSFIYLGILTYLKKIDEVKRSLPLILIGLAILFSAYSAPVLLLSFLEKKELERLAYFQSNPPSFPQVEVTSHANPDIYIPEPNILQPEPEPQPSAQPSLPVNTIDTKKKCEDKALQIGVKGSSLFLKDIIKRGYVTGYIIPYGGIDFLICIVGRPIVRDIFYGENGELRHQLNWIAERLYKIKQKVPTIKNQPSWFTIAFILDSQFKNDALYKNTEEGKTLEGLCQGAKAFFIVQQNRSIFFYCYDGKEAEKRYEQWQLNRTISHEAAHALDLRAGGGFKFLSETRNKEVYKFIKYTRLDILKEMSKFMMGDYGGLSKMCPNLKIEFPYFYPDFIKECREERTSSRIYCNITELFADMYGFFLVCDSNLNFPSDPALKAKFEEFLQILKKYNLL